MLPLHLSSSREYMDTLNQLCDWLYFGLIEPFFVLLAKLLKLVLLHPLNLVHAPIWLQICLVAMLTATLAFWLRKILRVDEKLQDFNHRFAEKRQAQEDFRLVSNKHGRNAMYQSTDDDLNTAYNTYLAGHYGRYVLIYLLPIFFTLAWLNNVYSDTFLTQQFGLPFVLPVPENRFGVQGLSVTSIFLLTYVVSLIVGFRIRRYRLGKGAALAKPCLPTTSAPSSH